MNGRSECVPVRPGFRTPGVGILTGLAAAGGLAIVVRYVFGLSTVTNLNDAYPWGLWKAVNVAAGVALAAGGFTTAALIYVFHRERFHILSRPSLLTALLGYTFVGMGLFVDLGRYYNIWHPILPSMWQGSSVLFEVGMCVMVYLTVMYIEFLPVLCDRFGRDAARPRLARASRLVNRWIGRTLFVFILLGVALSCMHQSSLGHLMLVAPTKMHPLWYTPMLGVLFFLSAVAVGFPAVIVASLWTSWSFREEPPMDVLSALARYTPLFLGVHLAFTFGNMVIRDSYTELTTWNWSTACWLMEVAIGGALPFVLLLFEGVRRSPRRLLAACLLVVFGVVLNRVNVFLVAYRPPYAIDTYFPSIAEWLVTVGLFACLALAYRAVAAYLPVFKWSTKVEALDHETDTRERKTGRNGSRPRRVRPLYDRRDGDLAGARR